MQVGAQAGGHAQEWQQQVLVQTSTTSLVFHCMCSQTPGARGCFLSTIYLLSP